MGMISILQEIREFNQKDLDFLTTAVEIEQLLRFDKQLDELQPKKRGRPRKIPGGKNKITWEYKPKWKPLRDDELAPPKRKTIKTEMSNKMWSKTDHELLKQYWYIDQKKPKQIAKLLGRSERSITSRLNRMERGFIK